MAPPEATISLRMDRLPVKRIHVLALALCALGMTVDTLEMALSSVLAAVLSSAGKPADAGQLALLIASVYLGAMVGAPCLGWLADRLGRRDVLVGVLAWLAVTSLGAAATNDVTALTVLRCLSGIGLGAYPPIVIAFLTDVLPPRRRGMLILAGLSLATIGPPIGIFLVRWLTPLAPLGLEAWRWSFLAAGCAAAVVALLFRALPESPRWLQARGRSEEAETAYEVFRQSSAFASAAAEVPESRPAAHVSPSAPGASATRRWSLVAILFLLSPWATVTFPVLTSVVLTQKGFRLADTLLYVGLATFGPLAGTLLSAFVVDRMERRVVLGLCAAGMVACGLAFVASDEPAALIAAGAAFNMFASLYIPALNVYGAELFPTRQRAGAIAGAWALNRLGAAIAPLMLLPMLRSAGPVPMFSVIAMTLVCSAMLLLVSPLGKQRQPVG